MWEECHGEYAKSKKDVDVAFACFCHDYYT
jgi:hypothetical protein